MREASVKRVTKETDIELNIRLDGTGEAGIDTGIGFFDHMLEAMARHGLFDLELRVKGDLHVDQHHTVEDTGIVLGEAIRKALGDKRGIRRTGHCMFPMDEALAVVALDLSGRPYLRFAPRFRSRAVGGLQSDLVEDFFQALASSGAMTIHASVPQGRSDHHKMEALFKALGKALGQACEIDPRAGNALPSTKGML